MRHLSLILMLLLLPLGSVPAPEPAPVEEEREDLVVGSVTIPGDTGAVILNPKAKIPIIFARAGEEQPDDGVLYGYYIHNERVVIFPELGEKTAYSVLLHEVFHHVHFLAADRGWTLEERVKLSWLLYQALLDFNEPSTLNGPEFYTLSHQRAPHWFTSLEGDFDDEEVDEHEGHVDVVNEPQHVLDIWKKWNLTGLQGAQE